METERELWIISAGFAIVLLWRLIEKARLRGHGTQASVVSPLRSTFALKLARMLRKNVALDVIFRFVFKGVVPVVFALGLIVLGFFVANRALFDAVSATGFFCEVGAVQTPTIFQTDEMCRDTGVNAVKGQRYKVTLSMAPQPGPPLTQEWFDKTIRTDFSGFSASRFRHYSATLMKRWWGQNWFKPIIRVGTIGNDEYPLDSLVPQQPQVYCTEPQVYGGGNTADGHNPQWKTCQSCPRAEPKSVLDDIPSKITQEWADTLSQCSPTPPERRVFVAEFTARTSGRVFIYVNDAVLAFPKKWNLFYLNNSGAATVTVKQLGIGSSQ